MFVVIQEVQLKKPNTHGAYREYEVQTMTFSFSGVSKTKYCYYPSNDTGRFERPHREAYKISIQENSRVDGKIRKKQCVVATMGYYYLAEDCLGLYDFVERGVNRAARMFGKDFNTLYDLVQAKIDPLSERLRKEFHETEEYKVCRKREQIQNAYREAKAAFAKKYYVDGDEYDYCYNIFGEVMNQSYLDEIIRKAQAYNTYSSHSRSGAGGSSYSGDYSSYFKTESGNYTENDKQLLKKFYKALSLKYHPDMNPDFDTTGEMQLLNRLKESWGI